MSIHTVSSEGYSKLSLSKALRRYISLPIASDQSAQLVLGLGGDTKHQLYRVSRQMCNGRRSASIIPVDMILHSVHLIPRFEPVMPKEWNSFTVLDQCQTFYVNPFCNIHSYLAFA